MMEEIPKPEEIVELKKQLEEANKKLETLQQQQFVSQFRPEDKFIEVLLEKGGGEYFLNMQK